MPLIKCPDCGNKYSDSAKSCNKCGFIDKVKISIYFHKISLYLNLFLLFLCLSIGTFSYIILNNLEYINKIVSTFFIIVFFIFAIFSIHDIYKIHKGNLEIRNRK